MSEAALRQTGGDNVIAKIKMADNPLFLTESTYDTAAPFGNWSRGELERHHGS